MTSPRVTIVGAFFVDLACRTKRMPAWGETLHGRDFAMGPGGKGSNQAVAAARQGASVELITRVGRDHFAQMARDVFTAEGIGMRHLSEDADRPTGTATIIVDDERGENAIIIVPGACDRLTPADIDAAADTIAGSALFVSQLELPAETCFHAIALASGQGVPVVLNPAPARAIPRDMLAMVDYLTPNETEIELLVGHSVDNLDDAKRAAHALRDRDVDNVLITLGGEGVYVCGADYEGRIPAYSAGPLRDTTGAGDAFNGGFVAALAAGAPLETAARAGCAVAGLSVTRQGTAPSMPSRAETRALLESQS